MRVATTTFPDNFLAQVNKLAVRQNRLQNQASTGQRLRLPSDDPAAMSRALGWQAESRALAQYQRNLDTLATTATATATAIKSLKSLSDRAGEIAVLADGLSSPAELSVYAVEVDQLIQQALQTANVRNGGDYLLAGTRVDRPPFQAVFDAGGRITAVNYQGNAEAAAVDVAPGESLVAALPGGNPTGTGPQGLLLDSRTGADFFGHLIALRDHLLAGDTAAVSARDIPQLAADEDALLSQIARNGAIQARLDMARQAASHRDLAVTKLVSQETDADLVDTVVQLQEVQKAYQAALQTGSLVMSQSLLDFLR